MKVLVLENNLMWSSKLHRTLGHFGHEATVATTVPAEPWDVAIVNLGVESLRASIPSLVQTGVFVIGHAGHKEKDLQQIGRELGCHKLATNSELTFKIENLLEDAQKARSEA